MKKILVVLVCFMAMGTMSLKAQDGNLTEGQWKHGLAVGAQWIATDLGFGKAESEIISKTSENYSLDDLRVAYGSKSKWVEYYDKLKAHEAESGNVEKLVSTIMAEYNKPYIKSKVKGDIEKYNASHDGNAVQSTADNPTTETAAAATTTTTNGGTNVVAATDSAKADTAKDSGEKESHGGHGFLYFISLLGLALGAIGAFLAMQARKENQIIAHDANEDIKTLQKQIEKLRGNLKGQGQDDNNRTPARRENKTEVKNNNDHLAQPQKIDFNKPAENNNKPAEKKAEPKREEVKKEEPKKEEVKREEAAPAPAAAFGEPRILFMAKPDENDNFSRSSSAYEPGNSIFELTTMDGKSGSFTVIGKSDAQKLALLMPGDTLARACSGNNIQSTAGKTRIVTDRAGRAQLENGKWHIVVKAIVHYA